MWGGRTAMPVLERLHRRSALRVKRVKTARSWTRDAKAACDAALVSGQTQIEMNAMRVLARRSQHLGSLVKTARAPTLSTQTDRHASRVLQESNQTRRETGVMPVLVRRTRNLAHCVRYALRRMRLFRWMGRMWTAQVHSNVIHRTHAQWARSARMRTTVSSVLQAERGLGQYVTIVRHGMAKLRMRSKQHV